MPSNSSPSPIRRKLRSFLSISSLRNALSDVWKRFPVVLILVLLYSLYGICEVWGLDASTNFTVAINMSMTLGIMLSLASRLWNEYLRSTGKAVWLSEAAALSLAAVNFVFILNRSQYLTYVDGIGYAAAYTALFVSILFLPPLRRPTIRVQWGYSSGVLGAMCTGFVLSIIFGLFSGLVFSTIEILFGRFNWRVAETFIIVLAGTLPAIALLFHLPRPENETDNCGYGLSLLTKNVLLPLALVYTLILYAYGLKILVTWALPNGNVCWMVTGLVSVTFFIVYGLQGYLCRDMPDNGKRRTAALAARYLPMLLLPLLVLMSAAIFYRISEYGVTPKRLYVASFNIWAYGVSLYLCIFRNPKLNIVAASFAGIFLLTSVIPNFNYCTWGINAVRSKVRSELSMAGVEQLPISDKDFISLLKRLPREQAESLAEDVSWLDEWDNHSTIRDIVISKETITRWELMEVINDAAHSSFDISLRNDNDELSPIPEGFTSLKSYNRSIYRDTVADSHGMLGIEMPDGLTVTVPLDSLSRLDDRQEFQAVKADVKEDADKTFYITSFSTHGKDTGTRHYEYIYVSGYMFSK